MSELSLQGRRRRQQERRQQALSMAPGAADAQIGPADPGDFDQLTQCLIQAPSNRPYFLLLQGYQDAQVSAPWPTGRDLLLYAPFAQRPNYNSHYSLDGAVSGMPNAGRCGPSEVPG